MAKTLTAFRRERGVTLIELMIAMGLSLLIGLAVIEVFLSQRQLFVAQDEQSRMQENARFVFEQVSRDLRMVGYWGCSNKVAITNNTSESTNSTLAADAVKGGSGLLTLKYLDVDNKKVVGSGGAVSLSGLTSPFVVANCTSATVFDGSTLPGGYSEGSEVFPLLEVTYLKTDAGQIKRSDEVLVDNGVDDFSFVYGVGTGDYVDGYKGDDVMSASDWANVKSVKMKLTLSSEHVKARQFISVIAIRNRLP